MFIDKVNITVKGGNGGDGCMSFRREKYVPKGGPNGGDGGRGGNITILADDHLRTLLDFSRKPKYEAGRGDSGSGYLKFGLDGDDLILRVPVGTTVYKGGAVIADLITSGASLLVAKGGRGGRGNVHFKSSTRQAPRIAEKGEPGEKVELTLQLRLIADVGLIGMPNAGKSTLLSRLTRARPKIAAYPFTTLFPNLGVARVHDSEIIFADIPGLIEGSHTGRGLGHEFLQHIERTRFLVHVVDPMGFSGKPPKENIKIINRELKSYSKTLAGKPQMLVVNKLDLSETDQVFKDIKKSFKKVKVMPISGVTGEGIEALLKEIDKQLRKVPPADHQPVRTAPVHIELQPDFWIEKSADHYVVRGKKVETLVAMTPMHLPEAIERTQHILKKIGIERALLAKGAEPGDQIEIAGVEFIFEPDTAIGQIRDHI